MKKCLGKILFLLVSFMIIQSDVCALNDIQVGTFLKENTRKLAGFSLNQLRISEEEDAILTTTTEDNIIITDSDITTYQIEVESNKDTGITWESSNTDVATVDENGLVTIVFNGNTTITATLNGYNLTKTFSLTVDYKIKNLGYNVSQYVVDGFSVVRLGYLGGISLKYDPVYSNNKEIHWEVEDESILTLNHSITRGGANGFIPNKVGTTKVFATTVDGSNIRIEIPIRVAVFCTDLVAVDNYRTLNRGETTKLEPILKPTNMTENITYRSADESVATVDAFGNVTAIGKGETTISVESSITKLRTTYYITVYNPLEGIKIRTSHMYVKKGTHFKIPFDPIPLDTSATIFSENYSSSNSNIVSVDNGFLYAKNYGTVEITLVSSKNFSDKCQVTVVDFIKGDLNEDGIVNTTDILLMNKLYFGKIEMNDSYLRLGDMNGNGIIDLTDVLLVIKTYFGKV